MKRTVSYNTKQREAVLLYLASVPGAHVSVNQIAKHLSDQGISVGVTTIYRHLDKLVEEGVAKKYILDGTKAACYQYVANGDAVPEYYHLKCENCGDLIHVECDYISALGQHFFDSHHFAIDPKKTIFYGQCSSCMQKK